MHCEKCGSADTEVTKCGKCGQKSLIRCHNCGYQVCADKYCEVISIKRKIKVLTYFAMFLILLMVIILPIVVMKAMDEEPPATPRPNPSATARPTPRPSPPPSPSAPPPPPTPPPSVAAPSPSPAPPPTPTGPTVEQRRQKAGSTGLDLTKKNLPYKKNGADPSAGGFDFVGFVQYVVQQAGVELSRNPAQIVGAGARIADTSGLEAGDVLVFSKEEGSKKPNFLGVYLGDGQFGCAYPGKGVIAVPIEHKFWKPRFLFGVRVIQ